MLVFPRLRGQSVSSATTNHDLRSPIFAATKPSRQSRLSNVQHRIERLYDQIAKSTWTPPDYLLKMFRAESYPSLQCRFETPMASSSTFFCLPQCGSTKVHWLTFGAVLVRNNQITLVDPTIPIQRNDVTACAMLECLRSRRRPTTYGYHSLHTLMPGGLGLGGGSAKHNFGISQIMWGREAHSVPANPPVGVSSPGTKI